VLTVCMRYLPYRRPSSRVILALLANSYERDWVFAEWPQVSDW